MSCLEQYFLRSEMFTTDQIKREAAFQKWCNRRALDLSIDKDAWGRSKYKHDMIDAIWDGYNWACVDANFELADTKAEAMKFLNPIQKLSF